MDLVCACQQSPIKKLYRVNLYYIVVLKLRTYDWYYSVVEIESTKFGIVIALLCVIKPSELVSLVKTSFNSMLIVGLYILCVVKGYNIYTYYAPWQFFRNYHQFYLTLYIDRCLWLTFLSDGVMFLHHDSY